MNTPTTPPRPVFAAGRTEALVNAGILPESVLEHASGRTSVVDYCVHDRRDDDRRDENRRETR